MKSSYYRQGIWWSAIGMAFKKFEARYGSITIYVLNSQLMKKLDGITQ